MHKNKFLIALLVTVMSFLIFTACENNSNNEIPETVDVQSMIKIGNYYRAGDENSEYISMMPNGQMQFVNFDMDNALDQYREALTEENITEDHFIETFTGVCSYHTFYIESENSYNIVAHIFGEDHLLGPGLLFYPEDDMITYNDVEYKYIENNGETASK